MDTASKILNETRPAIEAGQLSCPAYRPATAGRDRMVLRKPSIIICLTAAAVMLAGLYAAQSDPNEPGKVAAHRLPPKVLPIP